MAEESIHTAFGRFWAQVDDRYHCPHLFMKVLSIVYNKFRAFNIKKYYVLDFSSNDSILFFATIRFFTLRSKVHLFLFRIFRYFETFGCLRSGLNISLVYWKASVFFLVVSTNKLSVIADFNCIHQLFLG